MARLFFAIFYAATLVLWAVMMWVFTPTLSARALAQAEASVLLVPKLIALHVQGLRTDIQRAVLRAAADPGTTRAVEASRGRAEPPTTESLAHIQSALSQGLPPQLREGLVVGLVHGPGARVTRGGADVAPETVELSKLVGAGADGVLHEAFGLPHVFHSARIGSSELVVGAPLISQSLIEALIDEAGGEEGLVALGLVRAGEVLQAVGPKKELIATASALVPTSAARGVIVERGRVGRFGPFKLPSLTRRDVLGGAAPLAVASRKAMAATPYEVVAVLSVAPAMRALAESQKVAILGFVFLTGLAAVALVLLGGSRKTKDAVQEALPEGGDENERAPASESEPRAPAWESLTREPSAGLPDGSAAAPKLHAPPLGGLPQFSAELFGAAQAGAVLEDPADAKTIATLPPSPGEDGPRATAHPDEAHFEDVFRSFLATRQQCGEPAEGLTYERFAQKLHKNREQLIARYNCRTVRFQVYVKEGKAALKATPVKE
jgi:hypothetical protein